MRRKNQSRPGPARRPHSSSSQRSAPAAVSENIVYGRNPIHEILKSGSRRIETLSLTLDSEKLLDSEGWRKLLSASKTKIQILEPKAMNNLVPTGVHQNVIARVEPYAYADLDDVVAEAGPTSLVLVLDCVQDPQNFATLCRTALAFGVSAVVIPQDRAAVVNGTVCKASSGAVEHLKICRETNLARALESLKEAGFWIYGTMLSDKAEALPKIDPARRSALVLGSEGDGIRPLIAKNCDVAVIIPMANDFDSLNVAQAGAIGLYDFSVKMKKYDVEA